MKRIITLLILLLSTPSFAEEPEGLKRYREKMEYWKDRWEIAFKCENRYAVAMFMYDAAHEKGAHPSEVLSEVVEKHSLNDPDCIISSLVVLKPEQLEIVIKDFYEPPLFNKPEVFSELVSRLRANKKFNLDAAKSAAPVN